MIAAVGTASSAPTNPSNSLPITRALITVTALKPTGLAHQFRHQHGILELLLHEEERGHAQRQTGRHGEGHRDRRNRRDERPDHRDHLADARDQRQHVEIRHAHQPETDRRW